MTELQKLYVAARVDGRLSHRAALVHVARLTGIDKGTVDRVLRAAEIGSTFNRVKAS